MKIVIVGGGTAGWMAAALIAKTNKILEKDGFESAHDVTVIDSSDIPIIGAGEGSTGLMADVIALKLKDLGVTENEFIYETESTLKTGIHFKDWNGVGTDYLSPIGPTATHQYNIDLDFLAFSSLGNYYDASPSGHMLANGLSSFSKLRCKTNGQHAYHFDAHKVGKYLKKVSMKNGVKHIDDEVIKLNRNFETGDLDSVVLKDGITKISADFWIDCSGFSKVLIKPMGGGWNTYSDYLPVNNAMPYIQKFTKDETIKLETLAWAHQNGWVWKIPTQERYGCGYVYSDYFTTEDKVLAELRNSLGYDVEPIRNIKFECGRLNKFWINNVVATGLAGSFLEPLQATSIHTTIVQLDLLLHHYVYKTKEETVLEHSINRYNTFISKMVDDFRDLIQIHYMTKRDDSEFWKFCKNSLTKTDTTKYVLEMCKHRSPSMLDFGMYHGAAGWGVWCWTLVGLGIINKETAIKTLKNFSLLKHAKDSFEKISNRNKIQSISLMNNMEFMKAVKDRKLN